MKELTITQIILNLIGDIDFWGESRHDGESYDNIEDELAPMLDDLITQLYELIRYHANDYRASGKALAKLSYEVFKELKQTIDDGREIYEDYNLEDNE